MSAAAPLAVSVLAAGRMCPADYVCSPADFDRTPDIEASTLYVVGGLYGNLQALDCIERLAENEATPPAIIFNGDFHWFDAEPDWFATIDRRVAAYPAMRGNVETEISRDDEIGAGCGCAYPPSVDDGTVERSNEILRSLRRASSPAARISLAALPMHLLARVGRLRIGIVHGDAGSLAGWRFAHDALDKPSTRAWLASVRAASRVDVFASTHTCLAALRDFSLPSGRLTIINNGAAGMPNFAGSTCGLITRIALRPSPHPALYGVVRDGVHIDALPVEYDQTAFGRQFLARWPIGSPAYRSYFNRIVSGPDHDIARAAG